MILFTYIIASLSEKSLQCRTSSKFEHVAFALLSSATKLLFAHTSNLFSIFFSSTDSGKARPECVDRDEASYSKYAHTCVEQGTLGLTAARQNSTPQYNRETASSTAMTRPTAGNTTPPRFTRKRQQKPANKRYLKKPSHFKAIDTSWHYMHHFYTRMKRPYDKSHIPGIVNTPRGFYGTTSNIVGCLQFFSRSSIHGKANQPVQWSWNVAEALVATCSSASAGQIAGEMCYWNGLHSDIWSMKALSVHHWVKIKIQYSI